MRRFFPAYIVALAALVLSAGVAAKHGDQTGREDRNDDESRGFEVVEATIPQLQKALEDHVVTSRKLVQIYLDRIRAYESTLNAFITLNPHAADDARRRDRERARGHVRGPLHGIPIVLKDNILTRDIPTTGGALAFTGFVPPYEATLATKLRSAGAIILGKTVMTELANWVSDAMPGNYSATGGYGYNPYDPRPDPRPGVDARGFPFADGRPALATGGSSSGIATSANLAAANVGTETSGSILSPSNNTMLVGIKPTVGLISRYGVIPITADQDTAGPMTRDVASAAIMLNVLAGPDPLDTPATLGPPPCPAVDYTRSLKRRGLAGARIGVAAPYRDGVANPAGGFLMAPLTAPQLQVLNDAVSALRAAGASVADANIPAIVDLLKFGICAVREQTKANDANCSVVLKYGFKRDFNAFLSSLGPAAPVPTLSALRAFNTALVADNAIKYLQARLDISDEMNVAADFARYMNDRHKDLMLAGTNGIDAALASGNFDALLFPSSRGADIAARPGYPSVTVPFGFVPNTPTPPFPDGFNAKPGPYGITFTGTACSEPTLIRLAYAFEQTTKKRVPPATAPPLPKHGGDDADQHDDGRHQHARNRNK
jgi:amidase